MIVLDTSVLSRAFRRPRAGAPDPASAMLTGLIEDHAALLIPGIVYQELLSGLRDPAQVGRLKTALEPFAVVPAELDHHELAAEFASRCRASGVATSAPDNLIAAITARDGHMLFTSDADFVRMASCRPFHVRFLPEPS